jgi:predicted HicB family RNase H-like nuclease
MIESKLKGLPKFDSLDELVEFLDNNDTEDYLEDAPDVEFEVNPNAKALILARIEAKLFARVRKVAKTQNIDVEELINQWVEEKVAEAEETAETK